MLSITIVIPTIGKSNNLLKSLNNFLEKSLDEINIELIIIFDINQDSIDKNFLDEVKKLTVFAKNKNYRMIILDIPLLIENKINNKKDFLVFVDTNRNNILRRLKQRPNFNKKILNKLRENQIELSEKKKLADYIIDNNYPVHIIKKKIKKLKEKIINERNNT